ncbi:mechanosensitive ion channel [Pseudodesulfovibrio sp. F-1]|uniref:Mechanosensitive ion channel n=1 Tax=Pseudodesulfovibrio alkaliphilus TaxID=2661613 RepID=A0A7K1KN32_9BACT|nr:mechanosensitive ion channel domain-containing protein [Pseudodesulfovibrio alkaliphilus]MUM77485.1 mechanosensitive ion channel [Pseudodesulfovibrio alkaliphilus]
MEQLDRVIAFLGQWLNANVLNWLMAVQWGLVAGSLVLAALLWRRVGRKASRWVEANVPGALARSLLTALLGVGASVFFLMLLRVWVAAFAAAGLSPWLLHAASDLAVAWIAIKLLTGMMASRSLARAAALAVWAVAAMSVFGLLSPITDFLQSLSFSVGDSTFTALGAVKGLLLAGICLQAAAVAARFAEGRIQTLADLSPSLQTLLVKAVKVALFTTAILFAMSSVGIDLTSLAIFSSALGVGIGFGLKTIISNYVAGVLLLLDNSIKPGDTVEVGDVFGVVRGMHSRYTTILTRDGKEYLVPNEQLISGEVVNWTHSDTNVRLKISVGVAYESDVEKALALLEESAREVPRVLRDPAPAARLMGFGDSSVDLQLRVWIADAEKGLANVRSDVLRAVWKRFHEHGVAFPFPQRDVLLKPGSRLEVALDRPGRTGTGGGDT